MKTIQHRKNEINAMGSGMSNYLQFLIHMNTQPTYRKQGKKHNGTLGLNNPTPLFKEKFSKLNQTKQKQKLNIPEQRNQGKHK